ncbi:uncharacterized protein METZ01_LOCUS100952 [marine metagenome]|uniref:Uncharacterized protein n=1 Tax=marine metagenome TaxID=408172 RepID=A0A381W7X1_9ZZZZ
MFNGNKSLKVLLIFFLLLVNNNLVTFCSIIASLELIFFSDIGINLIKILSTDGLGLKLSGGTRNKDTVLNIY